LPTPFIRARLGWLEGCPRGLRAQGKEPRLDALDLTRLESATACGAVARPGLTSDAQGAHPDRRDDGCAHGQRAREAGRQRRVVCAEAGLAGLQLTYFLLVIT
jgi:hypothetical protein